MIYFISEKCVEERFARRFPAAATRLDRDKHRVNLRQLLGIVESHPPSAIGFVVQYRLSKFSGSACFPCAVSFWPQTWNPTETRRHAASAACAKELAITCHTVERGAAIRTLPFRSGTGRWCVRTRASNFLRVASSSELPRLSRSA